MATNQQAIDYFVENQTGDLMGSSLLYLEGTLYSYGTHWPLAVRINTPDGNTVVINKTKRGQTTAMNLNILTQALNNAGIRYGNAELAEMHQHVLDIRNSKPQPGVIVVDEELKSVAGRVLADDNSSRDARRLADSVLSKSDDK